MPDICFIIELNAPGKRYPTVQPEIFIAPPFLLLGGVT